MLNNQGAMILSERERANSKPIDGPYHELAEEIRLLLGYDLERGRPFYTARQAAMKSGVNHSTIASLVRGARASRDTLRSLAFAFHGDVNRLLTLAHYDPDDQVVELDTIPVVEEDERELLAFLKGLPPEIRAGKMNAIRAIFAEDDEKEHGSIVGKRSE